MRTGRGAAGTGVGAIALATLALALPAAAAGGVPLSTDTIVAQNQTGYTGGGGIGGAFRLAAGSQPLFQNQDPVAEHNVVATEDGPDGEPLFVTALVEPNDDDLVAGTQYLSPGSYGFYCTIHSGMTGTLEVTGAGAKLRPDIDVEITSAKLKKVARSGVLGARVSAATDSPGIDVAASIAGKGAGRAKDIELEAGASQKLGLKLGSAARKAVEKAVEKGEKVPVKLSAEVPWGAPAAARTKLG